MGALGKRIQGRDVEIGMILSFTLGLGVLFLKLYTTSASEAVGILFGSIFSVTFFDLALSIITGVLSIFILIFLYRPLLFASIDPEVASARGVPVQLLSVVFMVLLAVTVAQAVLVVGVLLVFALLIVPAATALHFTNRPYSTIFLSICLGLFFTWGGLFLSLFFHGPVSFFIAGLASLFYLLIVPLRHMVSPHIYVPLSQEEEV